MTKFTRSERLVAAMAAERGENLTNIGRRLGMSAQVVRRSWMLYREHGAEGFRTKNGSFSVAQKLEVLEAIHTQGLSREEAAVKYGINGSSTIWEWALRYLENRIEGLRPKKKGRRGRVRKPKVLPPSY